MKYLYLFVLVILILMSIAAGGVKLAYMPQEIKFFSDAGIVPIWILPLGAIQVAGGLSATYYRSRRTGAAAMAMGFLISTVVIFLTGNIEFAFLAMVPVIFSLFFVWRPISPT